MDFLDTGTYLYLGLIAFVLIAFLWSRKVGKNRRNDQKDKNFRRRYEERRGKK